MSHSRESGPSAEAEPKADRGHTFRPDIEGLRAVAVLAVLLFHAGIWFLPGGYVGVDVFLVISGYLITGLLVRELDRDGRISLPRFYAQRMKRLLPSLLLVLLGVVVLTGLLLPPVRQLSIAGDVVAAGTYVLNWKFAIAAVDYFAGGDAVSPLQHLWSLAVEEQFYLAWPALLVLAYWLARRLGARSGRLGLLVGIATVTLVSFGYNLELTRTEAGHAYFSTLARAWELGLGALLAILLPRWQPGRRLASWLWLAGAAAIALAVVLLTEDTLFPGVAGLLPTLGAAAMIAAGAAGWDRYPQRLLTGRAVRHVGRISYAWYLWHWPPIVFATAVFGPLSTGQGLLVVAASYVPALLSTQLVERPIRQSSVLRRPPGRALQFGLACTAVAVAAGLVLQVTVPTIKTAPEARAAGAKVLSDDKSVQRQAGELRPNPEEAEKDQGELYEAGCLAPKEQLHSDECRFGDPNGDKTVVLFGDSHAMHWFPALNKVAKKRGWTLVGLTKSGCQPGDVTTFDSKLSRAYTECDEWRAGALKRIQDTAPDLVVTSSRTQYTVTEGRKQLDDEHSRTQLRNGYERTLQTLQEAAGQVRVIDDVPPRGEVLDCVAANMDTLDRCAIDKRTAVSRTPLAEATRSVGRPGLIDPVPALCPENACPAVIGNVLVYRDNSHLSATYAATLDDWLDEQLPDLSSE